MSWLNLPLNFVFSFSFCDALHAARWTYLQIVEKKEKERKEKKSEKKRSLKIPLFFFLSYFGTQGVNEGLI